MQFLNLRWADGENLKHDIMRKVTCKNNNHFSKWNETLLEIKFSQAYVGQKIYSVASNKHIRNHLKQNNTYQSDDTSH